MNQEQPGAKTTSLVFKAFIWNGKIWIKSTPCKRLFNSTTVHEVVNRGDMFATCLADGTLTVVPRAAEILWVTIPLPQQVTLAE